MKDGCLLAGCFSLYCTTAVALCLDPYRCLREGYGKVIIFSPLPTHISTSAVTVAVEEEVDATESFFIVIFTIMAFSFVPAGWIMYIVREKDTKCKHQQVSNVFFVSYMRNRPGFQR